MLTAIRQWVIKTMMKGQTGIVKTLPKKDLVEFNVQMTAERLARNGVNPADLKNVNQVENVINQIENRPPVQQGIKSTKSAKVMDIEGNEIKDPKDIIGGKEINQQTLNEELMKKDNPYSDLVNTPRPKTIKEREAEVLARMNKENKEAAERIRNRKLIADAVDNASPGFVKGDRKYNAQLVADDLADKKFGKDFSDLDQKQQMDLYGEALDGLDDSDKFAQGGRAGFSKGSGKGILQFFKNMIKPRGKVKFDERKFREGPIDLDFLENIDKKDLAKFIRTRDTGGPGSYGMYENFADMPAGLKAAELIKTIKTTDGGINYKAAELFLGKRLKGNESVDELIQMLNRQEMRADGGRIGYKDGPEIKLFPRARGSQVEQEVGPGIKISERDIDYGITGLLEGDKFFGGASIDKGKVKVDVITPEGDTLFKDTIGKDDAINFILGMGDPKGDKFEIRTDKDLENMQFIIKTSFADGGRIGLKEGSGMNRRSFLKLLGGLASLPIIGKFLKPAKVASKAVKAAPVVSKSTPPAYFFELAETIKKFGKSDKVTYQDRVEIHRYTGKNGDDYELIEDLSTGDMKITKDKTGIGTYGDKNYDTINDRSVMEYRKGRGDETTKGTPPDEYDEYKVEFDMDGTEGDADNMSEFIRKEIIEETKDNAPSIKKASGGIARMLGE